MKIGFDITTLYTDQPPFDGISNYLFQLIELLLESTEIEIYGFGTDKNKDAYHRVEEERLRKMG